MVHSEVIPKITRLLELGKNGNVTCYGDCHNEIRSQSSSFLIK